jgi:hypothetical protein
MSSVEATTSSSTPGSLPNLLPPYVDEVLQTSAMYSQQLQFMSVTCHITAV